jgi:hypothetical protein
MDAEDTAIPGKKAAATTQGIVHLRVQQRNGRKSLTTCQGLATDLDLKKILRALKKVCALCPVSLHIGLSPHCLLSLPRPSIFVVCVYVCTVCTDVLYERDDSEGRG